MKNRIALILSVLISLNLYAQSELISGKVIAFKKYGLNGVKILAKKSKEVAFTDIDGNFTINCNKKDFITIRVDGFRMESVKINSKDSVFVNLIYLNNQKAYNDILENNYLSKGFLDYCVENLLENNNNYDRMDSIFHIIQSIYPGAKTSTESGTIEVILESRGLNTWMASPAALLVVDGVVTTDIATILPIQVKSVKVLVGNDAAYWGVRGGNGVVEIELKKGLL